MYRSWWQLPGPALFISKITQDLEDGKNVMVFVPPYAPRGMSSAIHSSLDSTRGGSWIGFRTERERPLAFLFEYFDEGEAAVLRNAFTLAHNQAFAGKVIWLEGIDAPTWGLWKEFFAEFGQVSQHIRREDRTVFCVQLTDALAKAKPKDDAMWSQILWRGATTSLDMLLFTSMLVEDREMPLLQKMVATSIISKLALWDPQLCERLSVAEMTDILNPAAILQEFAAERGWVAASENTKVLSWEMGTLEFVDYRLMPHSAILALKPSLDELNRRVWAAQMSILLPIVEDARQMIIDRFENQLKTPWRTGYGDIVDPRDLEINHINAQIKRGSINFDVETQQLVSELTEIRNRLSHLGIVTAEMLESKVLEKFIQLQTEAMLPYLQEDDTSSLLPIDQ